jgi:hypothetical protein
MDTQKCNMEERMDVVFATADGDVVVVATGGILILKCNNAISKSFFSPVTAAVADAVNALASIHKMC